MTPGELRTDRCVKRLEAVAAEYRELVAAGERAPAEVIAGRRGVSASTVRSHIHRARERGILPATVQGRASASDHEPRLVNWGEGNSWHACRTCRCEWPCPTIARATPSAGREGGAMTDVLKVIVSAIPVDPDDGCTIIAADSGNGNPLWGHPFTVAALIRDRLTEAGFLPSTSEASTVEARMRTEYGASHGTCAHWGCWPTAEALNAWLIDHPDWDLITRVCRVPVDQESGLAEWPSDALGLLVRQYLERKRAEAARKSVPMGAHR